MPLKEPIPIHPRRSRAPIFIVLGVILVVSIGGALYLYQLYNRPSSNRWLQYQLYRANPDGYDEIRLQPGMRCGDAPFAFPTTGVIFGLWNQSYRPGHIHTGLDIFPATEPGVTPIYAAYPGFLTRQADWASTVIIRIPEDPLNPNRQIWTYYTHMATSDGESFVAEAFPPGTTEVFVEAGTFLGYQGDYSGDPLNPTGLHLHFSVVADDNGQFLNETVLGNTYDPTPYFNLAVNHAENPDEFPICPGEVTFEEWLLVDANE
ncbi:MAG: M23 family peptidase [Chloroflexi bacterium]|nr:MAG: M23 family peptidase [Chloroflexota bacterium]MBL1192870.1 M23 family metallopeptidase [Chloroflexota bacterium]NOH10163.1 M23 family metallopeptidase [Chloroflexota bacterium]